MARLDIEVTDKAKTDLAYKIIENMSTKFSPCYARYPQPSCESRFKERLFLLFVSACQIWMLPSYLRDIT